MPCRLQVTNRPEGHNLTLLFTWPPALFVDTLTTMEYAGYVSHRAGEFTRHARGGRNGRVADLIDES